MANSVDPTNDLLIPVRLQAEIRAMAATAHLPPSDIVREALETYLAHQQANLPMPDARRRAASAARMRQQRQGRSLPAGMTIEKTIAHGRA